MSLSQFGISFSTTFIIVILPFFVSEISPYSPRETLLWVGWIVGSSGIIMTFGSAFWGTLTSRFSPKALFMRALFTHTILFILMSLTSNLQILLVLRIIQGMFGGISTVGFIMISASCSKEKLSAHVGFFQTFMTLGQLTGPPAAALMASLFGYRGAFIGASIVLFTAFWLCYFNVTDVPLRPKSERFFSPRTLNRYTASGWILSFIVTIQITFLPSVLPNVFEQFNIGRTIAVKWAGVVVMLYTGSATLGTYLWSKVSSRFSKERLIVLLIVAGTLFLSLLALRQGVFHFVILRMIQTGLVAATIPLVISIFAAEKKGGVIGFLNSARFAGNALGPVIATSVLALSNLTVLYLFLGSLTILILFGFTFSFRHFEDRVPVRD